MSKVLITKSKLDNLANAISAKSNSATSLSLEQMVTAVQSISTGSTINNQSKTVTPTEERQYTTPDTGYTGLSQVIVEPISSTYVGSGITTRTSTDLTASGATVTVPAGYYSENSSKTVTTAVQATPTIFVNTLTGEITATSTQSAGYVAAGTQTATEQLSIQAAATITPNNTSQTAVAANKYTTGAITVAAVPTETKSITANGTYTPITGKYFSSVTVNVPSVNISQDANGYIVMDDESGYGGGGGMGGLANMVDVSDQDYAFGYMLSAMKNGNTAGGTVTYSDNFPNTESLLLSTGLTTLHGFMFVNPATDVPSGTGSSAVNKTLFAFVKQDQTWDFIGVYSNTVARSYNNANSTAINATPVNGTLRISGGDIYYTGRYNKNSNYQILAANTQYEWLAW